MLFVIVFGGALAGAAEAGRNSRQSSASRARAASESRDIRRFMVNVSGAA
jgi:hypothetical protein